ncbi:unnamed protein product [Strongylus vulgaris]|uniref:Uncharacterized protein n=1 Tax=Strongylus vulgaris TaxID=40348 RepID=A0A3P7IZC5_STRVU|nr:unnamed protein product [Strongylus vulgaris]
MFRLRDPAENVSGAKYQWAGVIMRRTVDRWTPRTMEWISREAKRPRGRSSARWAYVFVTRMDQLNSPLVRNGCGPRKRRRRSSILTSWMTIARDRNGWKQCCGLYDNQRQAI